MLLLRDAPYLAGAATTFLNAIPLEPLLGLERAPVPGRVVSIGRMVPNKALTDLVRALARIRRRPVVACPRRGSQPRGAGRIEAEVDRLKVRNRVTFVFSFPEEELPQLLKSASLAAFPSTGEGFGISLLEAMAAGVPALANRIPAHEQLLGDLESQLIDFGDPDAAAHSIRRLLTADAGELADLSTRLRARAADFGIDRLRGQIDGLYARLSVGSRAAAAIGRGTRCASGLGRLSAKARSQAPGAEVLPGEAGDSGGRRQHHTRDQAQQKP